MTIEPHAVFGDLLRRARRDAGFTQEELAEQAGLSTRAISDLERGINRTPRRDTLDMLAEALELPPEERARWEQARRRLSTRAASSSAQRTPASSAGTRTQLPLPLTTLIGRERELTEVRQALSRTRLVTLTGPGGAGKTRLALAVADDSRASFNDGVFLVELAPVQQPSLIATAAVQALGIREESGQAAEETLVGFLRDRALLLVFDNFEHIVAGASLVRALLETCTTLTILATSRVPLKLRGEQEYPVRPLLDDASTALFVQRSREVKPDFDPGNHSTAIAEICRQLDGIPLAIELAAARSKVLTPAALLTRLEHPLNLLTGGGRDLPERQQTLRDTIGWSYNLLNPDAQRLFRSLSVFRGGWRLEAAEAVDEGNVLDRLTVLVESSLVEQDESSDGEPRFRMLETIREFGLEQLTESDEAVSVRGQHARLYAGLVETADVFFWSPQEFDWLGRLEQEHTNIQAALDWFAHIGDIESALRIAGRLWYFWWIRDHWTVARHYYDMLLASADETIQPATLAGALTGAGIMADWGNPLERTRIQALHEQALSIWLNLPNPPFLACLNYVVLGELARYRGDLQTERAYYEATLELANRLDSMLGRGWAFGGLGSSALVRGDHEQAIADYTESLRFYRAVGSATGTALTLKLLGDTLLQSGRIDEARPLLEEALALDRQRGHTRDVSQCLTLLGTLALYEGRLADAGELLEEGLAIAQNVGHMQTIGGATAGLANFVLHQKAPQDTARLFQESLRAALLSGDVTGIAGAIEGLAAVRADEGDVEGAVQCFATAAAYRESVGISSFGVQKAKVDARMDTLRESLPSDIFDEAWAAGLLLTPDDLA